MFGKLIHLLVLPPQLSQTQAFPSLPSPFSCIIHDTLICIYNLGVAERIELGGLSRFVRKFLGSLATFGQISNFWAYQECPKITSCAQKLPICPNSSSSSSYSSSSCVRMYLINTRWHAGSMPLLWSNTRWHAGQVACWFNAPSCGLKSHCKWQHCREGRITSICNHVLMAEKLELSFLILYKVV